MTQVVPRGRLTCHFDPTWLSDPIAVWSGVGLAWFPDIGLVVGNAVSKRAFVVLIELQLIKPPIEPALCEQILMRAGLANLTFVHHDDLVH